MAPPRIEIVKTKNVVGRRTNKSVSVTSKSPVSPPDGGWGWMVVFGSFMTQAIADGVTSSFCLFYTSISNSDEMHGMTKSDAAWIGSIMMGVQLGTGLLAGVLVNRFGCRPVSIAGSLLSAMGFAISYWASSAFYLCFSVGIIGGLGIGLIFLPAVVAVSNYFEKKRALATGIALCGSGFGMSAMGALVNFLIVRVGWRTSFLVVAATLLVSALFALLFRPLPTTALPQTEIPTVSTTTVAHNLRIRSLGYVNPNFATSTNDTLPEKKSLISVAKSLENKNNFELQHVIDDIEKKRDDNVTSTRTNLFNFSLLQNSVFVIFILSNFLTNMGTKVYFLSFADLAHHTLEPEKGDLSLSWLVISMGISNTLSKLVMGYLSDTKYVNRLYLYGGSLAICGIAIAVSAHGSSLTYLVTCSVVIGVMCGVYIVTTSVILVDLLGLGKLSNSFGIVLFCRGMGALIGPPFNGHLFDLHKHYTYGFWFAGISVTLSGTLMFFIPVVKRMSGRNHLHWVEVPDRQQDTIGKFEDKVISEKSLSV